MSQPDAPPRPPDLDHFFRTNEQKLRRAIARNPGLRPQDRDEVYSATAFALTRGRHRLVSGKSPLPLARRIAARKGYSLLRRETTGRQHSAVVGQRLTPDRRRNGVAVVVELTRGLAADSSRLDSPAASK